MNLELWMASLSTVSGLLLGVFSLSGAYLYQRRVKKTETAKLEIRLERVSAIRKELQNV